MWTYEINCACGGEGVLKGALRRCQKIETSEPVAVVEEGRREFWASLRAKGWREYRWHGTNRQLCPVCSEQFIAERKGR